MASSTFSFFLAISLIMLNTAFSTRYSQSKYNSLPLVLNIHLPRDVYGLNFFVEMQPYP